jgi:hypothetical protein
MQARNLSEEELNKKRKQSKFDNFFFDALYNVITYVPVMIISFVVSSLDLDK